MNDTHPCVAVAGHIRIPPVTYPSNGPCCIFGNMPLLGRQTSALTDRLLSPIRATSILSSRFQVVQSSSRCTKDPEATGFAGGRITPLVNKKRFKAITTK